MEVRRRSQKQKSDRHRMKFKNMRDGGTDANKCLHPFRLCGIIRVI